MIEISSICLAYSRKSLQIYRRRLQKEDIANERPEKYLTIKIIAAVIIRYTLTGTLLIA